MHMCTFSNLGVLCATIYLVLFFSLPLVEHKFNFKTSCTLHKTKEGIQMFHSPDEIFMKEYKKKKKGNLWMKLMLKNAKD